MRITGRITQGGQPFQTDGGKPSVSLIDDTGDRFEFDTKPDGTFSGPTKDDPRPLKPGKYEVLMFVYTPGVMGPRVSHRKDKIELTPDKTDYEIEMPPLPKGAAPAPPKVNDKGQRLNK